MRHVPDSPAEDLHIISPEGHGELHSVDTGEVLEMVLGDDDDLIHEDDEDVLFGRMSVGPDLLNEFDQGLRTRYEEAGITEGGDGDELDLLSGDDSGDDETPRVFEVPADDQFPVLSRALRKSKANKSKAKVVRIDTEASHNDFMCERAVEEISRRMDALEDALYQHEQLDRQMLEDHENNPEAHRAAFAAHEHNVTVLGASVEKLSDASTADDVANAMPRVPLDLPAYCEGKVKCWKDGDDIVCSIRFVSADGGVRVATMSARPKASADAVAQGAMAAGVNPVTVLGALDDLADVACAKRLVKDVAGAALKAHRRLDVCGMAKDGTDDPSLLGDQPGGLYVRPGWLAREDEPVFLMTQGNEKSVAVDAVADVAKQAQNGDQQAKKEMNTLEQVAKHPRGRALGHLVRAAKSKLQDKHKHLKQYTMMGLCL